MHQDTQHYLLRGARPSDPGGKHLITQEALDQQEQIHTAREGCGESELCSRLYWAVRDCTSQRRFRNISPEHSAFMRPTTIPLHRDGSCSPDDKGGRRTAYGETALHTPSEEEMPALCDHTGGTHEPHRSLSVLSSRAPSTAPRPPPRLLRHGPPHTKKAPHSTDIAAHRTQTLIGTAAAVPGGNHCYRRISQPPQGQQSARRKHCTTCFRNVQTLWLCANGWALRRTLAPKASPNGSCLVAENSCRCSTTSSAP
ncbi:putative RNase H [Trypanosoma cruzi]|uniref:Putative RNase H n=1 Tax=Trypanosoma cruzi TaxID=5693 RepID=A0A2V2UY72_TRYCR|nr:putative RNase H [Trypanosoma cruzi]